MMSSRKIVNWQERLDIAISKTVQVLEDRKIPDPDRTSGSPYATNLAKELRVAWESYQKSEAL